MTTRGGSRPNIVLINCDDLGYGDLGCYGSTKNATPVLDALAASGMRFTTFYMASPVCSPSRAALLTGCYPPRIGFGSFDGLPVLFPGQGLGLPDTEETIATVLSRVGYRTQMVGKWHCGDQPDFLPTRHGFDHYFGLPYSNDMGRQVNPPSILDWLPPLPLLSDEVVVEQQPNQASLTERYVEECLRFLRADDERPFFLYLAHLYVHLPIYVTVEALAASRNGPYGAAVGAIDWATGVLLDALDELGLRENTIVIFTSDNGSLGDAAPPWGSTTSVGGSNLPLRGAKGSTWEGGLRVPAIVSWPGTVPRGVVNDDLHRSLDLFPTLATLERRAPTNSRSTASTSVRVGPMELQHRCPPSPTTGRTPWRQCEMRSSNCTLPRATRGSMPSTTSPSILVRLSTSPSTTPQPSRRSPPLPMKSAAVSAMSGSTLSEVSVAQSAACSIRSR